MKVTIWEDIEIDPEEDLTIEEIIALIKENQDNIIDLLYNQKNWGMNSEFLYDTENQITSYESHGESTVELYDDNDNLIYRNGML